MNVSRSSLSALVVVLAAGAVEAQSIDLIEQELDNVRSGIFRLGAFYVTPRLEISAGYDSNALSTPIAESDVRALVGPGLRLAVPLGTAAFFDVNQTVEFVHYQEQVDLRRVFNVTRVGAGVGGRRWLLDVSDQFRDETARPTTEFDAPVVQRSNQFESQLSFALGWRHVLRFGYANSQYEIREGLEDETTQSRLDRTYDRGSVKLDRRLTAKTSAVAEGFFERQEFDDPARDGDSYGGRFGFEFNPGTSDPLSIAKLTGPFASGRFLLGFRNFEPQDPLRLGYDGLIGSVDVTLGFGEGQRLRGLYSRDLVPSILDENLYFVENRYGMSFTYQMTRRFSVTPGVVVGRNRYPLPALTDDGIEEIFDDHTTLRLGFETRVTERWAVGVTADYLERRSNVFAFAKDRLQVGFTMGFRP